MLWNARTWLLVVAAVPFTHLLIASALRIKLVQHGRPPVAVAPLLPGRTVRPGPALRWWRRHRPSRPASNAGDILSQPPLLGERMIR